MSVFFYKEARQKLCAEATEPGSLKTLFRNLQSSFPQDIKMFLKLIETV
jgi:hypothetical protein